MRKLFRLTLLVSIAAAIISFVRKRTGGKEPASDSSMTQAAPGSVPPDAPAAHTDTASSSDPPASSGAP